MPNSSEITMQVQRECKLVIFRIPFLLVLGIIGNNVIELETSESGILIVNVISTVRSLRISH